MHDSPNGVGLAYRYITHDELMRIADCDHAMFHWVAEGWDPTRDEDSQFEQDSRNHA